MDKEYKVSILVGNGFNHFVSHYFKNNKEAVLEKIKTVYLKKAIEDGMSPDGIDARYEEILMVLDEYKVLLNFLNMEKVKADGEQLIDQMVKLNKELVVDFIEVFIDSVKQTVKDKIEGTTAGKYRSLISWIAVSFNPFVLEDSLANKSFLSRLMEQHPDINFKFDIYTTNYDKIAEKVFAVYKNDCVNAYALHGDFKDKNIICHAPNEKKIEIEKCTTLMKRFTVFEANIPLTDTLILFGNSLESDPHILKVLNTAKFKQLIIIDATPHQLYGKFAAAQFIDKADEVIFIPTCKPSNACADYQVYDTPELLFQKLAVVLGE